MSSTYRIAVMTDHRREQQPKKPEQRDEGQYKRSCLTIEIGE